MSVSRVQMSLFEQISIELLKMMYYTKPIIQIQNVSYFVMNTATYMRIEENVLCHYHYQRKQKQ
jgi:hypothetical protein